MELRRALSNPRLEVELKGLSELRTPFGHRATPFDLAAMMLVLWLALRLALGRGSWLALGVAVGVGRVELPKTWREGSDVSL